MRTDTIKLWQTFVVTVGLLAGSFWALFLAPFETSELVIGAVIGWVTLSLNSLYADAASVRTARQQEASFDRGLTATPTTPIDETLPTP